MAVAAVLTGSVVASADPGGVKPGQPCGNADAVTKGADGRTLYCNPTVNGRGAGNLVWQLLP
ncbi:hypothetical protein [Nocardia inohanensis]|uniref:hypothetical protein n=1 Tax=Nocardia inohanensis TaxID=209246 RepID=UPI00082B5E4A|nr:hypothetical protein [Nocardia inohanensis]